MSEEYWQYVAREADENAQELKERNAKLVAALEAILAKDEHGFLITPLDNDLLEQAEKALGR